ncbi:hypothetical protein COOONC_03531 [Cooperia oncophora]
MHLVGTIRGSNRPNMDFMQLLDTANKNAKSLSKKLDVLKSEVDSEKRAELKRIEAEKRVKLESLKRKKETTSTEAETKFTIPKKKKDSSDEDKARILAFLAKKSEEERQALKKKQAEKDRLAQLRLQAHGGKVRFLFHTRSVLFCKEQDDSKSEHSYQMKRRQKSDFFSS